MASKSTQAWSIDAEEYDRQPSLSAKIAFLVRYAVLAPSPWNSQPWKFKISDSRIELFEVPERSQAHRDPEGREDCVGCGAALANLAIAAQHFALKTSIQLIPDGAPPHCVGIMDFREPNAGDSIESDDDIHRDRNLNERLFQAIPLRHCFRQDFLNKPIAENICQEFVALAQSYGISFVPISAQSTKLALAGMVSEGDRHLGADQATREEYASWIRANENKGDGVPGYALGLDKWSAMLAPVTHRFFNFTDQNARSDSALTEDTWALCAAFMGEEDSKRGWMRCGIALQNVLLLAASYGIQASFLNQIIPIPELRSRLSQLLGRRDIPQTVIRLGYPSQDNIKPTPRLPLSEVLL
ncbi:MAG: hypothetical protein Q4F00_09190 [bacterium]|nr:hypothetical protein [bacterium]